MTLNYKQYDQFCPWSFYLFSCAFFLKQLRWVFISSIPLTFIIIIKVMSIIHHHRIWFNSFIINIFGLTYFFHVCKGQMVSYDWLPGISVFTCLFVKFFLFQWLLMISAVHVFLGCASSRYTIQQFTIQRCRFMHNLCKHACFL